MKMKSILVALVCFTALLFSLNALAEFQLPEEPAKNIQTFTGCIKVWEIGTSYTDKNFRIVTAPGQSCKEGEIEVQFKANRLSDIDPLGRVYMDGAPGVGNIYKFRQSIVNNAQSDLNSASGRTPTSLEFGPVVIWCEAGSSQSIEFNNGLLSGEIFDRIIIDRMGIPGYGSGGRFPTLNVTLRNAKVISIKKIFGGTQREEVQFSYEVIEWSLLEFDTVGGDFEYNCQYSTKNKSLDGDDFRGGGPVTAIKPENLPPIPEYPNEFLIRYLEQLNTNFSSNDRSELAFNINKTVDPGTIANLFALLDGQVIERFNVNIPGVDPIQYRNVSVESVEIIFDSKALVIENVRYRGELME